MFSSYFEMVLRELTLKYLFLNLPSLNFYNCRYYSLKNVIIDCFLVFILDFVTYGFCLFSLNQRSPILFLIRVCGDCVCTADLDDTGSEIHCIISTGKLKRE